MAAAILLHQSPTCWGNELSQLPNEFIFAEQLTWQIETEQSSVEVKSQEIKPFLKGGHFPNFCSSVNIHLSPDH